LPCTTVYLESEGVVVNARSQAGKRACILIIIARLDVESSIAPVRPGSRICIGSAVSDLSRYTRSSACRSSSNGSCVEYLTIGAKRTRGANGSVCRKLQISEIQHITHRYGSRCAHRSAATCEDNVV